MIYDGIKWIKNGKYFYSNKKKIFLHCYMWEKHGRSIPKGYVIHHLDHNEENNDINNLCCMTRKHHNIYHSLTRSKNYREKMSKSLKGNRSGKDHPCYGRKHTEETKAKMSAAGKGRIVSEETRAKISAAKQNTSAETRAKISAARKGRIVSEETRAKLSAVGKGRIVSEETRAKLSTANKGRVLSEEWKRKISAARKGRVFTDEAKAKIRLSLTEGNKETHFVD